MISLTERQISKIREHTLKEYPNEACGFVTHDDYFPVVNVAIEPRGEFKIDNKVYNSFIHTHQVQAIYHSHVREVGINYGMVGMYDLRTPSPRDVASQQALGIPFLIGGTDGITFENPIQYPQDQTVDLYGRDFIFYLNDCFTLIADYYFQHYGIKIKPHHSSFDWINKGEGIVVPYYELFMTEWGFEEISVHELEVGDAIIMNIRGTANHLGVYVGENTILHHMVGSKSGNESRARLNSFIHKYIRHKDKPKSVI